MTNSAQKKQILLVNVFLICSLISVKFSILRQKTQTFLTSGEMSKIDFYETISNFEENSLLFMTISRRQDALTCLTALIKYAIIFCLKM